MSGHTPSPFLLTRGFGFLLFTVCIGLLLPSPASAVLDAPAPPVQSPVPEVNPDAEAYVPDASSVAETAAAAVKQAASHIQEAVQDLPLEQTPLGMAARPETAPPAP